MDAELCLELLEDNTLEGGTHPANFPELLRQSIRKASRGVDLTISHFWPPDFKSAPTGHWIHIQPWEFGSMHAAWLPVFQNQVDELWVYTNYVRDGFIDDGVDPEKLVVVPLAVDHAFLQAAGPSPLIRGLTRKRFKFFFCGGTIPRKGIDVLMKAYLNAFSRADDVCLIVKDMGTKTFYQGQNFGEQIREVQQDPSAPEVVYLDQTFTPEEMASLYRACNVLVHPYRGEGFGLPVAEAMACGLPVIVSRGGACDDFCPPDDTFWVDATVVPCNYGEETVRPPYWLQPSVDSLIEQMRLASANSEVTAARGARSAQYVNSVLSWEKTGKLIAERIRKVREKPIARLQGTDRTKARVVLPVGT